MANQARRKDPTRGVAIFFVVVIVLVLATILYKSISGRNAYEAEQQAARAATVVPAAGSVAGGSVAASAAGASQAQ